MSRPRIVVRGLRVVALLSAEGTSHAFRTSVRLNSTSSLSSSLSEGAAPPSHRSQRSFRRTRRTNYADREHLEFPELWNTSQHETVNMTLSSDPKQHNDDVCFLGQNGLLLQALATPFLGRVTYWVLYIMAYLNYGVGRVTLYTRRSTAPPLDINEAVTRKASSSSSSSSIQSDEMARIDDNTRNAVRHLIEMGAYEQVASISNSSTNTSMATTTTTSKDKSGDHHFHFGAPVSDSVLFRGLLHGSALPCVYIGLSPIHSRGLFTSQDIPRGTRIITEPQRCFMDASGFIRLLADTHQRLPDTWHYTHPTGALLELVTQPRPHHLMNHSCDANVCSGLSREFWPAAAISGRAELLERMQNFAHFDDANSFFTTQDVRAGEELTLNYGYRVAPIFSGENPLQKLFIVCRCDSSKCQHFVYRTPDEVTQLITHGMDEKTENGDAHTALLARLFGAGLDDEIVALSLLPSRKPILMYLRHHLAGSRRRPTKRELLTCYRHVFKLLNEAIPKEIGVSTKMQKENHEKS